jgi:hypothetical protein
VKRIHYAMLIVGLLWLSAVLSLVVSNAIVREIPPIGAIAGILDRLPPLIRDPIFALLWIVFLLGWTLLLIFSARPLVRRNANSQ